MGRALFLEITIAAGEDALEVDVDHRLVAAVRRGITEGKPTGKWTLLAARCDDDPVARVVGTLLCSPGERILFYPGASIVFTSEGSATVQDVDHLTLDPPNRDRWSSHITYRSARQSRNHEKGASSKQHPGMMLPWMSLVMPSMAELCALPAKLRLGFEYPGQDPGPFAQRVFGDYKKTSVINAPASSAEPSFWQFDFFVANEANWRALDSHPVSWDPISGLLSGVADEGKRVAGVLKVDFHPERGVCVIVTRPKGVLERGAFALHPEVVHTP